MIDLRAIFACYSVGGQLLTHADPRGRIDQERDLVLEVRPQTGNAVHRNQPPGALERITLDSLDMGHYESGRPDGRAACRLGDARFLPGAG